MSQPNLQWMSITIINATDFSIMIPMTEGFNTFSVANGFSYSTLDQLRIYLLPSKTKGELGFTVGPVYVFYLKDFSDTSNYFQHFSFEVTTDVNPITVTLDTQLPQTNFISVVENDPDNNGNWIITIGPTASETCPISYGNQALKCTNGETCCMDANGFSNCCPMGQLCVNGWSSGICCPIGVSGSCQGSNPYQCQCCNDSEIPCWGQCCLEGQSCIDSDTPGVGTCS